MADNLPPPLGLSELSTKSMEILEISQNMLRSLDEDKGNYGDFCLT